MDESFICITMNSLTIISHTTRIYLHAQQVQGYLSSSLLSASSDVTDAGCGGGDAFVWAGGSGTVLGAAILGATEWRPLRT